MVHDFVDIKVETLLRLLVWNPEVESILSVFLIKMQIPPILSEKKYLPPFLVLESN